MRITRRTWLHFQWGLMATGLFACGAHGGVPVASVSAPAPVPAPIPVTQEEVWVSTFPEDDAVSAICETILAEAYRRMGLRLRVRHAPGERALQLSNSGEVDGELYRMRGIDDQFRELVPVPVELHEARFMAFMARDDVPMASAADLRGWRVAYNRGAKAVERNLPPGLHTEAAHSQSNMFERLGAGRFDVVIDDHLSGMLTLTRLGLKHIKARGPLFVVPLIHYVHQRHRDRVAPLTRILREMKQSGEMARLIMGATDRLTEQAVAHGRARAAMPGRF